MLLSAGSTQWFYWVVSVRSLSRTIGIQVDMNPAWASVGKDMHWHTHAWTHADATPKTISPCLSRVCANYYTQLHDLILFGWNVWGCHLGKVFLPSEKWMLGEYLDSLHWWQLDLGVSCVSEPDMEIFIFNLISISFPQSWVSSVCERSMQGHFLSDASSWKKQTVTSVFILLVLVEKEDNKGILIHYDVKINCFGQIYVNC